MAEERSFSLRPYEPPSWARDLKVQPTSRVEVSRTRDLPAGDDVDIKSYCVLANLGMDNTWFRGSTGSACMHLRCTWQTMIPSL